MGMNHKRLCVVLGAGASHDAWNGGAPRRNANLQPPLARDLFDIGHHEEYWQYARDYPGAQYVAQVLAPRLGANAFNVESELRKFAEHSNPDKRAHYFWVPPYLRDLISACSSEYAHGPGNYVALVDSLLGDAQLEILFLVLNYDDMLERALTLYKPTEFKFEKASDYVAEDRQAKVVKIHGSTNWFKPMGSASGKPDFFERVRDLSSLSFLKEGELTVVNELHRTFQLERNGQHLYPLLTAPLAGKGDDDIVCPQTHLEAAKEFLSACHRYLVIGCSGLDTDLLSLISDAMPKSGNISAMFVSGKSEYSEATRRHFNSKGRFGSIVLPGDLKAQYDGGFNDFIARGDAWKFAESKL